MKRIIVIVFIPVHLVVLVLRMIGVFLDMASEEYFKFFS